jgi:glucose dehydrogenase
MSLTRRRFLATLSAALASGAAGCASLVRGVAPAAVPIPPPDVDVCVVGSGFAGTYLALRLVERGLRTVVVEAGPELGPDGGLDGDVGRFPIDTGDCLRYSPDVSRTIAVGGTSRKWTGVTTRLLPVDFRLRSEFGFAADWPLAYDDLTPYYCQAEDLLAVNGGAVEAGAEPPRSCPFPVEQGGYDSPARFFAPERLAFFPLPFSHREGESGPVRLSKVEVPRFAAASGAHLLVQRPACRLVSLDGRTIDHVAIRSGKHGEEALRARCFVVAAGVMESARLLLASRSPEFPAGLGNRSDLVGRFFHDHSTYETFFPHTDVGLPSGIHRSYSIYDRMAAMGLNPAHLQVHVERSGLQLHFQPAMEPRPENRLTLGPPAPELSPARLAFDLSERDRRTVAAGRDLVDLLATRLGLDPEAAIRHERPRFHPTGTCRMGFDEEDGVVDRDNRVFGIDNLYVSGASVFPSSATANPTVTVVALTLRLADHLIARLEGGDLGPA